MSRLSAVFLAGKIEDCRVGIRDLLEVYDKCTAENIKSCELLLIEVQRTKILSDFLNLTLRKFEAEVVSLIF